MGHWVQGQVRLEVEVGAYQNLGKILASSSKSGLSREENTGDFYLLRPVSIADGGHGGHMDPRASSVNQTTTSEGRAKARPPSLLMQELLGLGLAIQSRSSDHLQLDKSNSSLPIALPVRKAPPSHTTGITCSFTDQFLSGIMADSFADLWNSSVPVKPTETARKLGASPAPSTSAPRPKYDAFAMLASSVQTRQVVP